MKWLDKLKAQARVRRIMRQCNCVCYCPSCREPLNDQARAEDLPDGPVRYTCSGCLFKSDWDFDTPVPLLLNARNQ